MSWIAEYDTQGREFPTCVHVTKTTGTMTHGATYVPIEDGKAVRAENAKLRELVTDYFNAPCVECNPWDEGWQGCKHCDSGNCNLAVRALELGVEVGE